jgi:nucleotide-binding universal stress UspA family protein
MKIRTILVPVDFSDSADQAFTWAQELAAKWAARLLVLHVLPLPVYPMEMGISANFTALEADLRADAEKRVQALVSSADTPDLQIDTKILMGEPFHDICRVAEQEQVDLIVMGSQGLTGLSHVLLGSVAERTVRHAACPVLVVGKKTLEE